MATEQQLYYLYPLVDETDMVFGCTDLETGALFCHKCEDDNCNWKRKQITETLGKPYLKLTGREE